MSESSVECVLHIQTMHSIVTEIKVMVTDRHYTKQSALLVLRAPTGQG